MPSTISRSAVGFTSCQLSWCGRLHGSRVELMVCCAAQESVWCAGFCVAPADDATDCMRVAGLTRFDSRPSHDVALPARPRQLRLRTGCEVARERFSQRPGVVKTATDSSQLPTSGSTRRQHDRGRVQPVPVKVVATLGTCVVQLWACKRLPGCLERLRGLCGTLDGFFVVTVGPSPRGLPAGGTSAPPMLARRMTQAVARPRAVAGRLWSTRARLVSLVPRQAWAVPVLDEIRLVTALDFSHWTG